MADEFTKNIELNFISNIDSIQEALSNMKETASKLQVGSDKKGTQQSFASLNRDAEIELFVEGVKDFAKGTTKFQQSAGSLVGGINKVFGTSLSRDFSITGVLSSLVSVFKKGFAELNEMISYNYLSDSSVRRLRLTYGLDSGQAYGVSKADDIFGVSSLEDVSFMNDKQFTLFTNTIETFEQMWQDYADDESFDEAMYEFNIEIERLKTELLKPVMDIIITNKPAIEEFIKNLPEYVREAIEFLQQIVQAISDLLAWFGYGVEKKPIEESTSYQQATELATGNLGINTAAYGYNPADTGIDENQIYQYATRDPITNQLTLNVTTNVDNKKESTQTYNAMLDPNSSHNYASYTSAYKNK